jgi:hypothetical protein
MKHVGAKEFASGADETGPGAMLGGVADDGAGFVDDEELVREEEDPALELLR